MTYTPVPDDATQPVASVLAGTAAEEFRNIKTKMNNLFSQSAYNPNLLEHGLNSGIVSILNLPGGSDPGILYGHAINITRNDLSGPAVSVVAGQFTAALGDHQNGLPKNAFVFGIATEAWTSVNGISQATLIGGELAIISQFSANTMPLLGLDVVFKNRPDLFTAVRQGMGSNQFNYGTRAISIDSQKRSTAGEFCGWNRGISFEGDCLDIMKDANSGGLIGAIGIDFTPLGTPASTEPWTAYRMISAISLSEYMSITWDFNRTTRTWLDSQAGVMWFFGEGNYPTTFPQVGWDYNNGYMVYPGINTAGSASAGLAAALPATPSGYKYEKLNGTLVKIPYYQV